MDFNILKEVINDIIRELDHKYLNKIVDFNPTLENIAIYLFNNFSNQIGKSNFLIANSLKLFENSKSFVVIKREDN